MPVNTSTQRQHKAAVSLNFIIVGGSIAGLATAYALKTAGHEVLILEASDGTSQSMGGTQSTPNMTKILYQWGLQPALDRVALECRKFVFRNGDKGSMVGSMTMDEDFFADLLADYLFIQHQDLKDMISDLAIREGVEIAYEARVEDIDRSGSLPTVSLDTGESLTADVVIVADGYDSPLRPLVTDVPDEETVDLSDKIIVVNFILPLSAVLQDKELADIIHPSEWHIWWGSGWFLLGEVANGGRDYTVIFSYSYDGELREGDTAWRDRPFDYYGLDIKSFHSAPRKLLTMATTVSSRIFCNRQAPEDLVCDKSQVVLIGDAANPLPPGTDWRNALAFEDAQTLGCLFSRIQHRDQIPTLLSAYEELRLPRVEWTQAFDRAFHTMMKTRAGPEQDGRDMFMAASMIHGDFDHMDEASFKAVWGDHLSNYVYDAEERVEDWWSHWGSMLMRKQQKQLQRETSTDIGSLIPGLHRISISSNGSGLSDYHSYNPRWNAV